MARDSDGIKLSSKLSSLNYFLPLSPLCLYDVRSLAVMTLVYLTHEVVGGVGKAEY